MEPRTPQCVLNTGALIPALGLGTYDIPAERTQEVVEQALELGYRHLDCAASYFNEAAVGAAIRASGIPRGELFVTSKVRNCDQGVGRVRAALETSLTNLGLDHLDLYLVHWPVPSQDLYVPSYREVVAAHGEGLVRSPGVANFLPEHLRRVIDEVGLVPAVDQFEVHPSFQQVELREYCAELGIQVESYCPLGRGVDLRDPVVVRIAQTRGVTAAQVVLAWHLAHGLVAIPKSASRERQWENLGAAEVVLFPDEVAALDALDDVDGRICGDPAVFDWPQERPWVYE